MNTLAQKSLPSRLWRRYKPKSRLWRTVRFAFKDFSYLFRTSAPSFVYGNYLRTLFRRKELEKYESQQTAFRAAALSLRLSNDWFTENLSHWLLVFEDFDFHSKNIEALEIGSWEGLASRFVLQTLPNSRLTCVDTWQGADEHKGQDVLNHIEEHFDSNVFAYRNRLAKHKGTSFGFFCSKERDRKFDLIYVDGSHFCDDVILDAFNSFEHLRVGGIIIFDDYLWRFYKRELDNPAAAINAFLKIKEGKYRLVRVYKQLILEKIADR